MSEKPWESLEADGTWRGVWEGGPSGPLPVLAARGTCLGPTLLVTAGVHGDEYEGPAAIHALFRSLRPGVLAGRLIGLPVVNVAAWQARTRCAPGWTDLNRAFPGDPRGDAAQAHAEAIFETFVAGCDALWDMHSGGIALVHLPLAGWYGGGSREAERLARWNGAGFRPWLIPDVPGVLSYEAHRAGKIAVGSEWGGGGRLDPSGAARNVLALCAALRLLGMHPDAGDGPAEEDTRLPIAGGYQNVPATGLFVPAVALGDAVSEGAHLGTLSDALGEEVHVVQAERGGTVAGLPGQPWLWAGDRAAYVG